MTPSDGQPTGQEDAMVKEDSSSEIPFLVVSVILMVAFCAIFGYLVYKENGRIGKMPPAQQAKVPAKK
jgi:hypothetical protein